MSHDASERQDRARVCRTRPGVEALEGRALLSGGRPGPGAVFFVDDGARFSRQAEVAEVTLARAGSPNSPAVRRPLEVEVTTAGGTAVAGAQYRPIRQTVTFAPGETTRTVAVPLVPGASNPGQVTLGLTARPVGAGPRRASAATIRLVDAEDVTPPAIVDARLLIRGDKAVAIEIFFSEPMDPRRAANISNYVVYNAVENSNSLGWALPLLATNEAQTNTRILVRSARYDPERNAVTLELIRAQAEGRFSVTNPRLATNRDGSPDARALLDAAGNVLNGTAGGFRIGLGPNTSAWIAAR